MDSSIWLESNTTRIVWITLLAAMDEDGYAHFACIKNLALRANVTDTEAQEAIDVLLAPDPNSSNPANEGRRIERIPGGYLILNAIEYRNLSKRIHQREQTRQRVKHHRLRKDVTLCNDTSVTPALQSVTSVYEYDHIKGTGEGESEGDNKSLTSVYEVVQKLKGELAAMWHRTSIIWPQDEELFLVEIAKRPESVKELAVLKAFRAKRGKYFPHSVTSLLANWQKTLDQARNDATKDPNEKPKPKTIFEKEVDRLCNL